MGTRGTEDGIPGVAGDDGGRMWVYVTRSQGGTFCVAAFVFRFLGIKAIQLSLANRLVCLGPRVSGGCLGNGARLESELEVIPHATRLYIVQF